MTRWDYMPKGQKKNYNYKQANKGMFLEKLVEQTNQMYQYRGIGTVQKIATPVKILEIKNNKVYGYLESKSTLDFRGSINLSKIGPVDTNTPGPTDTEARNTRPINIAIPISFDCKESTDEKGLPLKYISEHQLQYMQRALEVGEITFLIVWMHKEHKGYLVEGETVIQKHQEWQENKGKRGYNTILTGAMHPLMTKKGYTLHYAKTIKNILKNKGYFL